MDPMIAILKVQVFDLQNRRLSQAQVEAVNMQGQMTALKSNKASGAFEASLGAPARYTLKVSAPEYKEQTRKIQLNLGEQEEIFILGADGQLYYYRGRMKVPFEPLPDTLGVVLSDPLNDDKNMPGIAKLAGRFKLAAVETGANLRKNGLYIYRMAPEMDDNARTEAQELLGKQEGVVLAAPVLKLFDQNATLLTDTIIVKFNGDVTDDEVQRLAKEQGLTLMRSIPYAGNAYQFRVTGPISYKVLDICERLVQTDRVEYAEPDLWHTSEDDTITPTDWLFPQQWDHAANLLNTPNAWQTLANISANKTFGDPNVIIAVVDSGIDAGHPAFSGNVTNGQPKVYKTYDFINMVPNNNVTSGSHGTCCSGAAAGRANDPSPVAGVNAGTVGIAGNCRLIGVRRTGPESTYADIYIWTGGFDPHSTLAGFPAKITPGADIISNSFGYSVGSPISGLMQDCFDFLTTYGRGGKGVLLFFSAGNDAVYLDTTFRRPWGMYRKCHSVAASTLNNTGAEVKTYYSNYGSAVKFCAPSNSTTDPHNPPAAYGAWTATIRGEGDVPGYPARQTTLTANAAAGATVVTVANITGIAAGQAVLLRAPGAASAESHGISAVNVAAKQITLLGGLLHNQAAGTMISAGPADYDSGFGGTSYSTPVTAGVAALVLSANSHLTWIEVREILESTARKIDPNNTDPDGRWRDTFGRISTDPAYTGPYFSKWYGFGRIDASAAVEAAAGYSFQRDILVRDVVADAGLAPSTGAFWEGADIWVRNANDNVAPANYATHANTVHQDVQAGQSNWVYVRFKNIGNQASYDFNVRVYVAHWPGSEFIYPNDYMPTVHPHGTLPSPLTPGTYLLGEAPVGPVAAGAEGRIAVEWRPELIPPKTIVAGGQTVHWHPCLLVEITPQDGFTPTGSHVWQNNNLAQKNLTIIYSTDGQWAAAGVLGHVLEQTRRISVKVVIRWPVPPDPEPFYVQFLNKRVEEMLVADLSKTRRTDIKVVKTPKMTAFHFDGKRAVTFNLVAVGPVPFIIGGNMGRMPANAQGEVQVIECNDGKVPTGGLTFLVRGKPK